MRWPDVILLNGTTSSGKTTLAKALQARLEHPYLHFGFDALVMMMPERYWKDVATSQVKGNNPWLKDGVEVVESRHDDERRSLSLKFGPVFQPVIRVMPVVVASIVKSGTSVIFDHVIQNQSMYDNCIQDFLKLSVVKIAVTCPIDLLEKREIERGDRLVGLARGQYDVVHSFGEFDLKIDTGNETVEQSVSRIEDYLKHSG